MDGNEHRDLDLDDTLLREVDGWTYQTANFDGEDAEVRTIQLDRPVILAQRRAAVTECCGGGRELPPDAFAVVERRLSPRAPYIATPRSHIDAAGYSWDFRPDYDMLVWRGTIPHIESKRGGSVGLDFHQVIPGGLVLITLSLAVAAGETGGSFSIFSYREEGQTMEFPVYGGYRMITVDLVARPTSDHLYMQIGIDETGMELFDFCEVAFRHL
jgi:hypothetical protein